MSVFFSSHQIAELKQIADHVAIIDRGRLVVSGALDELRESFCRIQLVFDGDGSGPHRSDAHLYKRRQPMRPLTRLPLLAALLLWPASFLLAQSAVDPSGHWEGAVQAPGTEVKFEVDLAKNSKGELEGTFGQPAQNLKGLLLSNFSVEGKSIRFQIKGAPGERAFEGTLAADGRSISGTFTQSGYAMPFSMARTGDARIEVQAKSAPIGKELEGTWNGTLDANGVQRRLALTMSNQADAATASIVNVDEGLEIPITAIVQTGSSLTFEVKAVGGFYSGVLNLQRTELAGTWTQGAIALPLSFRLAKP